MNLRIDGCTTKNLTGFTRTDLLAALATLTLLGLLQATALGNNKETSRSGVCLSNLRRLGTAWTEFANDNNGTLSFNGWGSSSGWIPSGTVMDFNSTNTDNTNSYKLVGSPASQLGPYSQNPKFYKCPSDQSQVTMGTGEAARLYPRVRSYSMSVAMDGDTDGGLDWVLPSPPYRTFHKISDIVAPPPANAFVLIDEHANSIDDGIFALQMPGPTLSTARFQNLPAARHDGAGALSFADSHAELHFWRDPRTTPPESSDGVYLGDVSSPNNPDVRWLSDRTSSLGP